MNDPNANNSQESFKDKWDSVSKHESTNNTFNRLQASQVILEALKNKRRSETSEWLGGLERENIMPQNGESSSIKVLEHVDAQSINENTLMGQAIKWLDKMFVQFELFAANFNLSVRGTNLVVSCTRPIKRTNDTGGLYSENTDDCLSYAGHIATQSWALVVRGCASKVEVFIIPAELLIAFSVSSADESGYEPLLVIESAWQGNQVIWHVQNHLINADQIPALAKELFGDLIKVASGQMSEAEVMANPIQTISSNDNPVVPAPSQMTVPKASQPLIEQIVNPQAATQPAVMPSSAPLPQVLPSVETSLQMIKLDSLKVADSLLHLIEQDIQQLMEFGKKALEADDGASFEGVKDITSKLDTLKKGITVTLESIRQTNNI